LITFGNDSYYYHELADNDSIDIERFLIEDYECNDTGYFSNYMHRAGYATLRFEFGDEVAFAYDPTWEEDENADERLPVRLTYYSL